MLSRNSFAIILYWAMFIVVAEPRLVEAQAARPQETRAGLNGVGVPRCVYCPQPGYSQKARKAEISGKILLDVTVTTVGRVRKPVVIKGLGMGLDENALEAVRNWKMKPALGPDGKPVNCRVQVEVAFHLHPNAA
jgi:TonB family protein